MVFIYLVADLKRADPGRKGRDSDDSDEDRPKKKPAANGKNKSSKGRR